MRMIGTVGGASLTISAAGVDLPLRDLDAAHARLAELFG